MFMSYICVRLYHIEMTMFMYMFNVGFICFELVSVILVELLLFLVQTSMKLFYPLKINVELNGEGHDYNTRNNNNMAVIQHKLQFFL